MLWNAVCIQSLCSLQLLWGTGDISIWPAGKLKDCLRGSLDDELLPFPRYPLRMEAAPDQSFAGVKRGFDRKAFLHFPTTSPENISQASWTCYLRPAVLTRNVPLDLRTFLTSAGLSGSALKVVEYA